VLRAARRQSRRIPRTLHLGMAGAPRLRDVLPTLDNVCPAVRYAQLMNHRAVRLMRATLAVTFAVLVFRYVGIWADGVIAVVLQGVTVVYRRRRHGARA
jgi:hypothetical protein